MGSPKLPKKRVAFVLIDGLGDVSLPRLGYKTPLQAAKLPNLDGIASAGVNGLMDPVEVGLACGSDTAHLSLLGYDPRVYYRGRGAFESMGAGLAMSPGDIAFKVCAELSFVIIYMQFQNNLPLTLLFKSIIHANSLMKYLSKKLSSCSQILQLLMRKLELSLVGELTGTLKKKVPYYVPPSME